MADNYNNRCRLSTTSVLATGYNRICSLSRIMGLKDRLAKAMAEGHFSQSSLAREASKHGRRVSQQAIGHILSGRNLDSALLPEIAAALQVSLDWLSRNKGEMRPSAAEALLVGKVGAGAEIHRFEHPDVLKAVPLHASNAPNVAEVEGDSMYPLMPGDLIFYGAEGQGVHDRCVGRMCVVQVKDGPALLKILKRGSKKGLWRLESSNSPSIEDVKLEWAAKVEDIRPK